MAKLKMFEVKLRAGDGTERFVRLNVADETGAREVVDAQERKYVEYDLTTDPALSAGDMDRITSCYYDNEGKVRGGAARDRLRFHMHHQTAPYQVVSVEEL